jgi:Xaa-Pro aminopeptidase
MNEEPAENGGATTSLDAIPAIPPARYSERLASAQTLANESGLAAVLVGVGADLRYLTGYVALPLERLTMLVVPAAGRIRLVVPRLEAAPAGRSPAASGGHVEIVTWDETDDPHELVARLVRADLGEPAARGIRVAVSDTLWASHVLALQDRLGDVRLSLASTVLRELRMIKDADEIELLRRAAHAADRVVQAIAAGRLIGRTEADVAREVRDRLLAEGHEEAHFAIVGSGPNSASPHHEASDRIISPGEPIVLDIGGSFDGYCSDITRTLWVTDGDPTQGPDERFRHLFAVLYDAQAAATRAARPGTPCEEVDRVARERIDAEGYGEQFFHRTGHGIGLEGHEHPYLVVGNREPLREGMAFSVEPGIYFEGEYGARIEDIVVCGPDGPIVLNEAPRELYLVDG